MDALKGATRSTALDMDMEDSAAKQTIGPEKKRETVHEEMKRVNRLPPSSAYASHRLRVLNKILQLLAAKRTTSEDAELELLFAGLSL